MIRIDQQLDEKKNEYQNAASGTWRIAFESPVKWDWKRHQSSSKLKWKVHILQKVPLVVEVGVGDNWLEAH